MYLPCAGIPKRAQVNKWWLGCIRRARGNRFPFEFPISTHTDELSDRCQSSPDAESDMPSAHEDDGSVEESSPCRRNSETVVGLPHVSSIVFPKRAYRRKLAGEFHVLQRVSRDGSVSGASPLRRNSATVVGLPRASLIVFPKRAYRQKLAGDFRPSTRGTRRFRRTASLRPPCGKWLLMRVARRLQRWVFSITEELGDGGQEGGGGWLAARIVDRVLEKGVSPETCRRFPPFNARSAKVPANSIASAAMREVAFNACGSTVPARGLLHYGGTRRRWPRGRRWLACLAYRRLCF